MKVFDKFGDEVTDPRWHKVELCVREFIRRYPLHWAEFKRDLASNRTEYGLAQTGDLKEAGWRNTAAFPVVYRRAKDEDGLLGTEDDDLVQVASLVEPLRILLPGLLERDEPGKPNKLYKEFLRRFPVFRPADKS